MAEEKSIKEAYINDLERRGLKVTTYPSPNIPGARDISVLYPTANSTHAVTASAPMHDDHDYNSSDLFAPHVVRKEPVEPQWLDKAREVMEAKNSYADQKAAEKKPVEMVNHPSFYNQGKIEVIDFIEDQKFGFLAGQVIKYVARARHKGSRLQDYKKAEWYLNRLIARGGVDIGEEENEGPHRIDPRVMRVEKE